jgi:quinol-cytochrome oxidoreductase complex cytochrome b subunit
MEFLGMFMEARLIIQSKKVVDRGVAQSIERFKMEAANETVGSCSYMLYTYLGFSPNYSSNSYSWGGRFVVRHIAWAVGSSCRCM